MTMDNDETMYELEYPEPETQSDASKGLSLVVALQGYADAGQAIDNAGSHIKAALEHAPLATFNNDLLIDYRSRRPAVHIVDNELAPAEKTELSLDVVRDNTGIPFLLLSGPEPDLRWSAFTEAVTDLSKRFKVTKAVSLYSAPMPVPHTRPLIVTQHGSYKSDPLRYPRFDGRITVPGSAQLELEMKMAKEGIETAGFTAHVPHYIAASEYPSAVVKLLQAVEETAGVSIPLQALERESEKVERELEEQVEESGEIAAVVHALEAQYDQETARYRERHDRGLLSSDGEVPTGDEIGAELEKFLAQVNRDKDTQDIDAGDDSTEDIGAESWDESDTPRSYDEDDNGGDRRPHSDGGDDSDED